jgi:antirestriction protein ArdC
MSWTLPLRALALRLLRRILRTPSSLWASGRQSVRISRRTRRRLRADLRITDNPHAVPAQYLASWLAVLKADKKVIFAAA